MIAVPLKYKTYLHIATGIALILLIGFKTIAPVVVNMQAGIKVKTLATDPTENDGEKKAEVNPALKQEKEFTSFYSAGLNNIIVCADITHRTAYQINYKSACFFTITAPPPDSRLV